MSTYFLDLGGLLGRIDSATTYYEVLGVGCADGQEKIKSSFQQLLNLLFPPHVIARTMPENMTPRIERAFSKSSQAFAVLASYARRNDYNVYTLVRRVEPPRQGVRAIGVEFIGEHPPAGFLDKPWSVFRPRSWGATNAGGPIARSRLRRSGSSTSMKACV